MLRDLRTKRAAGFASIVEVIVTTVIFILATAGILSTVSMLKPHARGSTKEIEAAYVGKAVIDQLRKQVAAADGGVFFGSNLSLGTHNLPPSGPNGDYTVSYTVTEPIPNVRKLSMTITWPDL